MRESLAALYHESPTWAVAVSVGVCAAAFYIPYKLWAFRSGRSPIKKDFKEGVVYLYQFPRTRYTPSSSSPCMKLETWLRMANIPYENVCTWWARSSEGTVPFIEHNGREYPDSSLAIRDMMVVFSKSSMEGHLNDEQQAAGRAFEKLTECSLAMADTQLRYIEHVDDILQQFPSDAFGIFTPFVLSTWKYLVISRKTAVVKASGVGKHDRTEIVESAVEDLRAISNYLGIKHYVAGHKPCRVDATLFAYLAQMVYAPFDYPLKTIIFKEFPNLRDYCDRIKERYWPDWEECTTLFESNSEWRKKL